TTSDVKWGVIDATLTLADGKGTPTVISHSIRPRFGSNVTPMVGGSFAELSTGAAAGKGDTNPDYQDFEGGTGEGKSSAFPADFLAANQGKLPNAPNCPAADPFSAANDPVMLTLTIRVPTNAKSFTLSTDFFSSEFPEYTCSMFNDFFVVLLDSKYAGMNPNPTDKNLAFYTPPNTTDKYPVGVNLATGNTGLFTQCVNGHIGCAAGQLNKSIATCTSQSQLAGTGLDTPSGGECDGNSVEGGGTGWLVTAGNVVGGEVITLRIAIWDTSDGMLDSLAIIDGFTWSVDEASPGTVIF
ncbi:MAG TPA: choice-of-anchor L domain-containing protein, partial [Kofleriaceae bacterium]|nr:choice-of-anchor L domain-containing protein [Kofleriaceae bacterium]